MRRKLSLVVVLPICITLRSERWLVKPKRQFFQVSFRHSYFHYGWAAPYLYPVQRLPPMMFISKHLCRQQCRPETFTTRAVQATGTILSISFQNERVHPAPVAPLPLAEQRFRNAVHGFVVATVQPTHPGKLFNRVATGPAIRTRTHRKTDQAKESR